MLADTIERVNKLRKQALNNPEFIRSSEEHKKSIAYADNIQLETNRNKKAKKSKQTNSMKSDASRSETKVTENKAVETQRIEKVKKRQKRFSEVYHQAQFKVNPSGATH